MKKRNVALAALLVCASTAWAQQYEDYARVISSIPEYERVNTPREECYSEYEPQTRHGDRNYAGGIIGGITGGVIGAHVGKGNGAKAATAAKAVETDLAGGDRTITISLTALLIIILLVLLVILVAD